MQNIGFSRVALVRWWASEETDDAAAELAVDFA